MGYRQSIAVIICKYQHILLFYIIFHESNFGCNIINFSSLSYLLCKALKFSNTYEFNINVKVLEHCSLLLTLKFTYKTKYLVKNKIEFRCNYLGIPVGREPTKPPLNPPLISIMTYVTYLTHTTATT